MNHQQENITLTLTLTREELRRKLSAKINYQTRERTNSHTLSSDSSERISIGQGFKLQIKEENKKAKTIGKITGEKLTIYTHTKVRLH